ncbi:VanZ family protein [Nocardioides humilatus]|uniref:VanZ family protein n=1 Tax=Nocardioides humilatus TaxID=2607660 RepID=A0A5B1LHU8_9ACTN|nr:VanZ family protein [Nocardioides humilatus]KAA1420223.1 VanZ family protein [Nocardioides humilatus]
MSDQATNALIATGLGTVVAVVLLIPVAAYEYRRDGKLGPGDLAILLSGAVYGLALWTYTLLPMPAGDSYQCVGRQTEPLATIRAIGFRDSDGLVGLVRDPAFLQVALNVLLFVPLGFYVRKILGRGVVVATVLGLGFSLLIETTQTTGVWHLFDCAYRRFDVDDLIINTTGATVGSLLAALVVRRRRGEIVLPTSISYGRRLVGMVCDVLFVVLLGAAVVVAYKGAFHYGLASSYADIGPDLRTWLQWGVPAVVEAAMVLLAGRTVGELVVDVRAVARRRSLAPISRLLKLVVGVGPLLGLGALTPSWSTWAFVGYAVVTVAAAALTTEHRGLSHLLAGMDLEITPRRRRRGLPPARS